MMSEWHEVSLGSLTEWTSGGTPRKNEPNYWDGVIPWISANSMKKSRLEDSELKITPLGLENGSRLAGKGSILLLVRGSELHNRIPIGIAMKPLAFNQDVKALKAHDVLLPEYLLYWLLGNEKLILTKVEHTGIGAGKLDTNVMKNLRIHLPPLPDQHKIVGILSKLDDKIELNRQMNKTLEAIARAIFKSWFVDFDPVHAKAEGRDTGLPKESADLFPDSFEETELGEVPKGWKVWRAGDVGDIICGKTPSTKIVEYYGDDVAFITIPDMHGNVFSVNVQKKLSYAGAKSQLKKMLPSGTICVSCIATPGLVVITTEESQTNQQINSVVPHESDQTYYWFWVFRDLGDEIKASGSGGSVLTNLSTGRFSELRVQSSTAELRSAYHLYVGPIFKKILSNIKEMNTLAELRDTLLPKLISGHLQIKDAEQIIRNIPNE